MQGLPPPSSNEAPSQKRENPRFLSIFNSCFLENYLILIIISFSLLFVLLPFTLFHVKRERQHGRHVFAYETEEITQPLTIARSFRWLQLENELNLLLIRDNSLSFSGVALEIDVGSAFDPDSMPGLAHLLEHMIFLGSKEHPNASFFRDFVGLHGGKTNALTNDESSRYYFSINPENLAEALEIFASLFEAPLLDSHRLDQETLAVNNEFHMNLQKDSWRFFELLRRHSHENHTFHRFSAGNLRTLKLFPEKLGLKPQETLRNFFENYYSSHKINVLVLGSQNLDFLQKISEKTLSRLKNLRKSFILPPKLEISQKTRAFPAENLGKIVFFKTLGSETTVSVVFPLEIVQNSATSLRNSLDFLDFLLNFRGKGGLFCEMWRKQLVFALETAKIQKTADFLAYIVTFSAADVSKSQEIVAILFDFLRKLKEIVQSAALYERFSAINEVNFRFLQRKPLEIELLQNVERFRRLVNREFCLKELLKYQEIEHSLQKKSLENTLEILVIEKSLVFVGSKKLEVAENSPKFKENSEKIQDFVQDFAKFELKPRVSFKETKENWENQTDFEEILEKSNTLCEFFEENQQFLQFSETDRRFFSFFEEKSPVNCHSAAENLGFSLEKLSEFEENMKIYYKSQKMGDSFLRNVQLLQKNSAFSSFSVDIPQRFFPNSTNSWRSSSDFLRKSQETAYFPANPQENCAFPQKIAYKVEKTQLWQRFSQDFRTTARIFLRFSQESLQNLGVFRVFAEIFARKLEETHFDALLLGFKAELSCEEEGFQLKMEGFSEKFAEFYLEIVQKFVSFSQEIDEKELDFTRKKLEKQQENANIQQALPQILEFLRKIIKKTAKVAEKSESLAELQAIFAHFLRKHEKTALFLGNVSENASFSLLEAFETAISQENASNLQEKAETFCRKSRIFRVSEEFSAVIFLRNSNELDENQGIVNYYEIGERNDEILAKSLVISQFLSVKAFDFLRTSKQLGYIVYCKLLFFQEIAAFSLNIQGITHSPCEMSREIELFLQEFENFLENCEENEIQGVLRQVAQKFSEENARDEEIWREIVENNGDFAGKQRVFKRILGLSKGEIVEFFKEIFKAHCRKLSLRLFLHENRGNSTDFGKIIENSNETYCGKPEKIMKEEDFFLKEES